MAERKKIAILGCGWLGLPIAASLAADGHSVKGSTRTTDKAAALQAMGIRHYAIDLDPEADAAVLSDFLDADRVMINIPPGRGRGDVEDHHPRQIAALLPHLSKARQIIFVSSTSVYPSENRTVVEEDAGNSPAASGRALLRAEAMLRDAAARRLCIVRPGGLLGGDRHPGRFLARREYLTSPDTPTNLIGRDDLIAIIRLLMQRDIVGETFNAVCPKHPTRREFYTREAAKLGIELPPFEESAEQEPWKIVSSEKLMAKLGYQFLHPDPSDVFSTPEQA